MGVGEGNGRRLIHGNSHGFYAGIHLPVGIIHGHLLGTQSTRLQACDGNGAVIGRGEGRTGYSTGAGCIIVQADFPTTQILARVCFLDQLHASGFQLVMEADGGSLTSSKCDLLRICGSATVFGIDGGVGVTNLLDIHSCSREIGNGDENMG